MQEYNIRIDARHFQYHDTDELKKALQESENYCEYIFSLSKYHTLSYNFWEYRRLLKDEIESRK